MLFHLLFPLREHISGLNVFRYQSFRAGGAAITALLIAFLFGPYVIRKARALHLGQEIRPEGPKTHLKKQGTPTFGGVIILVATVLPLLLWCRLDNVYVMLVLLATVFMGAVGFLDDYLKVVKKLPKGLIGRYKIAGQMVLGCIVGSVLYFFPPVADVRSATTLPFFKNYLVDFGVFYIPVVVFIITAMSNSANLADGADGLCIGLSGIAAAAFGVIAYVTGRVDFSHYLHITYLPGAGELMVYAAALVGACLGFLWFNAYPAEIFMGDTGALSLGASLGTMAILIKKELLLPIICGVFMAESISVMVQVAVFKRTGRRVFRMAPIHHHFEIGERPWPEPKMVVRFWIVGILLVLLSLASFKVR
ncbi:MAG: phospho-N-acetylmuramoyl-pentapeptide-transferase [candidate division KSB1 bacterium]|nr:phospho-N-acetylmuramoyl-pentapeptide-transferase [candidate division KSB1 bacterium]MDZ7294467.1 phospho-N-acetylmuramoyl-pentapeptide-transferase [candidate division KSB1 bacterium]MDZ7377825.1 phospho-N-acetylmuramoyl-pentapeptide-transferase [candidate division KSB1 bacterium]MDZ7386240.1 phospho-N-acetylmuramoyl-pentapeptide-transferase [candidate division KSB1 bacterium]MDZ7393798.1 phospho-N-acetylmuramoyl-pentapeptide-transferase [candidate division KSB1 bacterium]